MERTTHHAWRVADGLPHGLVREPLQDRHGYLWFGTAGGLVRLDGRRLRIHDVASHPGLASNVVGPLAEDHAGRLWIGTRDGLSVLADASITRADAGLPVAAVTALEAGVDGSVWVAVYGHGLYRGTVGTFSREVDAGDLPAGNVNALLAHPDGSLWIGSTLGGLARWRGGTLQRFGTAEGLADVQVSGLALDAEARLLVATQRMLLRESPSGFSPALPERMRSAHGGLRAVAVDRQGRWWLGTADGLLRWDGRELEAFGEREGLTDDFVTGLHLDREGNAWVATREGLNRLGDSLIEASKLPIGQALHDPLSICTDGSGVGWATAARGGLLADRGAGFVRTTVDSAAGAMFCLSEGGVIFTTRGRTMRMPGDPTATPVPVDATPDIPANLALAVFRSRDGSIWVGTNGGGVARIDPAGNVRRLGRNEGLPSPVVTAIGEDARGRVWLGTEAGAAWTTTGDRVHRAPPPLSDAPFLWAFVAHADGVLAGHADGIAWTDGDRAHGVDARSGLSIGGARHLAVGPDGELWIAGDLGLAVMGAGEVDALVAGQLARVTITRFGLGDGLRGGASGQFQSRGTTDASGRISFIGSSGLVRFNPARMQLDLPALQPRIDAVEIDGEPRSPARDGVLVVPANARRVSLQVSTPRLTAPERVQWRYQLRGFDPDWIPAAADADVATYTSLPPGEYSFALQASDDGLRWQSAASALRIERRPRAHQTVGFWLLLASVAGALAWLAHRRRMANLEARHIAAMAERARLARELHDTLLQCLGGINLQLQAISLRLPSEPELAGRMLEGVIEQAAAGLVEARDAVWDMRAPPADAEITRSLRRLVERVAPAAMTITHAWPDGPVDLAPPRRHALARVAEEAFANAIRHSGASHLHVALRVLDGRVELEVRDDGRGFRVEAEDAGLGGHWGVLGMRERMESVGGTLRIDSAPGHGTRLLATVPTP